jgi:hypothetical protein
MKLMIAAAEPITKPRKRKFPSSKAANLIALTQIKRSHRPLDGASAYRGWRNGPWDLKVFVNSLQFVVSGRERIPRTERLLGTGRFAIGLVQPGDHNAGGDERENAKYRQCKRQFGHPVTAVGRDVKYAFNEIHNSPPGLL